MCEAHAYKIAENTHYCKKHYKKWEKTSMSPRAKTCGQCTDFRACAQKAPAGKAGEWFEWAACPDFIEKDNGKVKAIKIDRYDRLQNRLIKEARNGKSSG
jgi:hypothetical protein